MRFGSPHRHFRRTDSTNERAKELALSAAPGGLVVTADEQTAGRGRRGNEWFAPPGTCLLYSALLRPFAADDRLLLPLAVPIAVCEAAEAVAPVRCQLKWPNDVWVDERKVAALTPAEDDEHIARHLQMQEQFRARGKLGPAARLEGTTRAKHIRTGDTTTVVDGPYAETKEQFLGFYIIDCETEDEAIEFAKSLPSLGTVFEVRPVKRYFPP